jgi:hypothetical protein
MTWRSIDWKRAFNTVILCSALAVFGLHHCRADDGRTTLLRPLEADEVERLEPSKLKELVVRSQDQIEITSKLDGVMVTEIRLSKSDENRVRTVELEGRVRDPQQRALVARVVEITMQSVSFWSSSDDEFVVNPEKLTVTEPSAELGAKSLGAAMEQFFAGQHERADMLLTHALVESPGNEVTHYWKVANCIALKQTDRAERRLEILTRRNPMGSDGYAGQLQRLQGQYRRAIIDMEQKLMLKSRSGIGTSRN